MEIDEFKALLAINKATLDDEVSKQPMLYFEVSEAYVDAAAVRDACKEELTSIDATLDGEVRLALGRKEEKVTEAMVKNAVQTHQKHQDAFDTYMSAKNKADLLAALKDAFSQRSYMLRDLIQLYMTSYYEKTSMGGDSLDKAKYQKNRERLAEARAAR
jgi:hypothetical protein